jgi:hypothetical protein
MGWTTMEAADEYLARGLYADSWSQIDDPTRERFLYVAWDRLRDHPDYVFPEEPEREMAQAQALYAAQILNQQDGVPDDVKSYRLLDYSVSFGKRDGRSILEGEGLTLPRDVADKLSKYSKAPVAIGYLRRE